MGCNVSCADRQRCRYRREQRPEAHGDPDRASRDLGRGGPHQNLPEQEENNSSCGFNAVPSKDGRSRRGYQTNLCGFNGKCQQGPYILHSLTPQLRKMPVSVPSRIFLKTCSVEIPTVGNGLALGYPLLIVLMPALGGKKGRLSNERHSTFLRAYPSMYQHKTA